LGKQVQMDYLIEWTSPVKTTNEMSYKWPWSWTRSPLGTTWFWSWWTEVFVVCIGRRQPHSHRHKCGAQTRLHCLADCVALHWQNAWWKRCKSKHMSTTSVHQMTMQCMHVKHILQWAALLFVQWFVCSFTSVVKGCHMKFLWSTIIS
jgi:hypothetical protein